MKKRFLILIPILIFVDQIIKIIITKFFFYPHVNFPIIDSVFTLYPYRNIHLGWIPNMFDFMTPLYFAISLSIVSMVLLFISYRYFTFLASSWERYKKLPDLFLILTFAGGFCKIIDDIFWYGSLDYILLFDWFIFDLKDVYLLLGAGVFFVVFLIVFYRQYYKIPKERRKEYKRKIDLLKWIKSGLPLEQ